MLDYAEPSAQISAAVAPGGHATPPLVPYSTRTPLRLVLTRHGRRGVLSYPSEVSSGGSDGDASSGGDGGDDSEHVTLMPGDVCRVYAPALDCVETRANVTGLDPRMLVLGLYAEACGLRAGAATTAHLLARLRSGVGGLDAAARISPLLSVPRGTGLSLGHIDYYCGVRVKVQYETGGGDGPLGTAWSTTYDDDYGAGALRAALGRAYALQQRV